MNKVLLIGLGVVVTGAAVFGFTQLPDAEKSSTSSQPTSTQQAPADKLTFERVTNEVSTGNAVLYDVRTADEFASGHFAQAINFPLQTMQSGTLPDVAKNTKIYVYCRSGNRSGQATDLLIKAGYSNITDLKGLTDVEAIGGTLVQSDTTMR